jgi:hypothetical protein
VSAHAKAQALRFARSSGYAFVAAFLATGGHLSWWQLLSLAAGALETGLREVLPVAPLPTATAAPADPPEPPGATT